MDAFCVRLGMMGEMHATAQSHSDSNSIVNRCMQPQPGLTQVNKPPISPPSNTTLWPSVNNKANAVQQPCTQWRQQRPRARITPECNRAAQYAAKAGSPKATKMFQIAAELHTRQREPHTTNAQWQHNGSTYSSSFLLFFASFW
jgi:hypothetical protein